MGIKLVMPLVHGEISVETSISPGNYEFAIRIPERGNPDYPKTHRPEQFVELRATAEELREVVRNLDRFV